jgi:hypothetical protein
LKRPLICWAETEEDESAANPSLQLVVSERPPRIDDGPPFLAAIRAAEYAREVEHTEPTGHLRRDRRHGYLGALLAGQTLDGDCIFGVNVRWSTRAA